MKTMRVDRMIVSRPSAVRPGGPHLRAEGIVHRYGRSAAAALDGIDLEVGRGEVAAIVGQSGSGKSTLLHIVAGLTHPQAGSIMVGDKRVTRPGPQRVLMFQDAALYPWMTVIENAGLGLRFARRPKSEARQRAYRLLETVGLAPLADVNAQRLSGGQQQRVALARALAPEPDILLLDEPFSSLDPFTRAALQRDVRAIARRLGITVVIVTHDLDEALTMADRIHIMSGPPGRIAASMNVDLGEPHDRDGLAYRNAKRQLTERFESVARGGVAPAAPIAAAGAGASFAPRAAAPTFA